MSHMLLAPNKRRFDLYKGISYREKTKLVLQVTASTRLFIWIEMTAADDCLYGMLNKWLVKSDSEFFNLSRASYDDGWTKRSRIYME